MPLEFAQTQGSSLRHYNPVLLLLAKLLNDQHIVWLQIPRKFPYTRKYLLPLSQMIITYTLCNQNRRLTCSFTQKWVAWRQYENKVFRENHVENDAIMRRGIISKLFISLEKEPGSTRFRPQNCHRPWQSWTCGAIEKERTANAVQAARMFLRIPGALFSFWLAFVILKKF